MKLFKKSNVPQTVAEQALDHIRKNNPNYLKELLNKNALPYSSLTEEQDNHTHLTGLQIAAQLGYTKIINIITNKFGAHLLNEKTRSNKTIAHFAAESGQAKVLKYLLKQGISIQETDNNGQSPLHLAATNGQEKVINFYGEIKLTDWQLHDNQGNTPLDLAKSNPQPSLIKKIQEFAATSSSSNLADTDPVLTHTRKMLNLSGSDSDHDSDSYTSDMADLVSVNSQNHYQTPRPYYDQAEGKAEQRPAPPTTNPPANHGYDTPENNYSTAHNKTRKKDSSTTTSSDNEDGRSIDSRLNKTSGNSFSSSANNDSLNAMFAAIVENNLTTLIYLEDKNADLSATNTDGVNAGHIAAAKASDTKLFHHLIQKNVDFNAKTKEGATSIHFAAQTQNIQAIKFLQQLGQVNLAAQDNDGVTIAHIACTTGDIELLEYIAEVNKALLNTATFEGLTPLHIATINNQKDIVSFLRDQSVDLRVASASGWTSAHYAAAYGREEITDQLDEYGLAFNQKTTEGFQPLHLALANQHQNVTRFLRQKNTLSSNYAQQYPLHSLTLFGQTAELENYLNQNPDAVNGGDDQNNLALHLAAGCGSLEKIKLILDRSSEKHINATNKFGLTPLHWAAIRSLIDDHSQTLIDAEIAIDLLISRKAEIDATTAKGATPLLLALKYLCYHPGANCHVAKKLLIIGANPKAFDTTGKSAEQLIKQSPYLTEVLKPALIENKQRMTAPKTGGLFNQEHQQNNPSINPAAKASVV